MLCVINCSTIYLRECDILALLGDFYGFVQMIVLNTILIGMITQPTIKCKLITAYVLITIDLTTLMNVFGIDAQIYLD